MSSCRLNPKFKAKLTFLGGLLLQLLGLIVIYMVIIGAIGSFMYLINIHEFMVNLITSYGKSVSDIPNVCLYILKAGQAMFWISVFIVLIITVAVLLLYVLIAESYESYRMQSLELSYKFEGVKQPWYRVLLSYVFVCDRTA